MTGITLRESAVNCNKMQATPAAKQDLACHEDESLPTKLIFQICECLISSKVIAHTSAETTILKTQWAIFV